MPVSDYYGVDGVVPRDDLGGLNLTTVPKVMVESQPDRRRPLDRPGVPAAGGGGVRQGHQGLPDRVDGAVGPPGHDGYHHLRSAARPPGATGSRTAVTPTRAGPTNSSMNCCPCGYSATSCPREGFSPSHPRVSATRPWGAGSSTTRSASRWWPTWSCPMGTWWRWSRWWRRRPPLLHHRRERLPRLRRRVYVEVVFSFLSPPSRRSAVRVCRDMSAPPGPLAPAARWSGLPFVQRPWGPYPGSRGHVPLCAPPLRRGWPPVGSPMRNGLHSGDG
jgi:hypothetical protein